MRINTRKKKAASKYCCNILKRKRHERNVSVREVAKRVGLPLWLYWYLENHIQYMANDMLRVIFDALDVNYTRG